MSTRNVRGAFVVRVGGPVVYEAGCLADCDECGKEIDGMSEPLFACTDCPMSVCGECFDGEDGDPCPACGVDWEEERGE